jgi:hypothetical protein
VPARVEAIALLDTGAEVTCLGPKLIEDLSLPYDGPVLANAPALSGATFASQYDASLTILHPSGDSRAHLEIGELSVLELPLYSIGYQAIIGRDALSRSRLLYNGIQSRFALKY